MIRTVNGHTERIDPLMRFEFIDSTAAAITRFGYYLRECCTLTVEEFGRTVERFQRCLK